MIFMTLSIAMATVVISWSKYRQDGDRCFAPILRAYFQYMKHCRAPPSVKKPNMDAMPTVAKKQWEKPRSTHGCERLVPLAQNADILQEA